MFKAAWGIKNQTLCLDWCPSSKVLPAMPWKRETVVLLKPDAQLHLELGPDHCFLRDHLHILIAPHR